MPNDMSQNTASIAPLIASGAVNHSLKASDLPADQEARFLRAICEQVSGSIYRSGPFDYLFAVGADEADLPQLLLETLGTRFEGVGIDIASLSVDAPPQENTSSKLYDDALRSGALEFEGSNDAGKAAAIVTTDFAVSVAEVTANRLASLALKEQENQLLQRFEALEARFAELTQTVEETSPLNITEDLNRLIQAIEAHSERLNGNLTQDRLDTLISLVTPNEKSAQKLDPDALERLASAIELLQDNLAQPAQPDTGLLDLYFEQLLRQSQMLAQTITNLAASEIDIGTTAQQLSSFQSMAEAGSQTATLTPKEKIENLGEISSGLSSITHRITRQIVKISENEATVLEPSDSASETQEQDPPEDTIIEAQNTEIQNTGGEEGIKLVFEPSPESVGGQSNTNTTLSEEELDRRVEELLRSSRTPVDDDGQTGVLSENLKQA